MCNYTGKVVIIDDDEMSIRLIKYHLKSLFNNIEIETYTSPIDALERIHMLGSKIDVVITDLTMPNISGYDILKSIREALYSISVILITANAYAKIKHPITGKRVSILVKPYNKEKLLNQVEVALGIKNTIENVNRCGAIYGHTG